MRRALVPLTLFALSACGQPAADGTDADTDRGDTEKPVDTDTQVPDDTDTDPGDTEVDSDTDVTSVTIPDVRDRASSSVEEGDVVQIEDVVVTGVRQDRSGFVVQDKTASSYGGIFVALDPGAGLPTVGKLVRIVGRYEEVGSGVAPDETRATIVVGAAVPGSSVGITGTGTVPAALPQTYVTNLFSHADPFESMVVRVTVAGNGRLLVDAGPAGDGSFALEPPPSGSDPLEVGAWFVDPSRGLADLGPGASFAGVRGILELDGGLTLQPTGAADLTDYVAPDVITDTDVDADTDTDTDIGGGGGGETDSGDTFEYFDTDTGSGTPVQFVVLTPEQVHAGLPTADETFVTVEDVVVTAVFDGSANKDHFVVQSTTGTTNAGLWVFAGDNLAQGLTLPAVVDIVDVTGQYTEYPLLHGTHGTSSQSRLVVNNQAQPTGWSSTGWTVKSSGNPLPAPIDRTPAQFSDLAGMEAYESMRVRLIESGYDIQVFSTTPQVGTTASAARVTLDSFFHNVKSDYAMSVGAKMDSITGIYYARYPVGSGVSPIRLAPTSAADVVNYH
jgi:hypothetical protein